ncbi:MAG TPA: hypothetical protein ENG40_03430 [Thermoprotei archaeon]|nr:hypothetical protein [Thermoprotei archaeon]
MMELDDIFRLISEAKPQPLPHPPTSKDYVDHVIDTALRGYPELAADSLLNPLLVGRIKNIVGSIVRQLNLLFERDFWLKEDMEEKAILRRAYSYSLLFEIAINFYGMEKEWVGFSDEEVNACENIIRYILNKWEEIERKRYGEPRIAKAVVMYKINDMKKVMAGDPQRTGMIYWMGENIEKKIDEKNITNSFLNVIKNEIKSNIYYIMSKEGICRFGNDYAIGLRWLRHLGYVQVSTNPQLAAIAYRDDPSLWDKLKQYFRDHPELLENIEERKDELAMTATMLALWPNMEVFRPVAYLLNFTDGMVSYQLNPNVAASYEGSLEDALKIYSKTQEYFKEYDEYLLWGWPVDVEKGRPNIVFKVAGNSPAAIDITRKLESLGIGTNNTVTYTVSQEVKLILAKMEGMAEAVKKGILTTKVYETNMGGRLDDHLREIFAAKLVRDALKNIDDKLSAIYEYAKKIGINVEDKDGIWIAPTGWGWDKVAKTLDEKIELICSRQYLKRLNDENFAEFLAKYSGESKENVLKYLEEWEKIIGMAGTLVAQRVWWIFFSKENKDKWLGYLISKYNLSPEKAKEILNNIDVLPASKRKPLDTYLTLARNNMTNTEFPNHQLNVLMFSRKPGFELKRYDNAITIKHDPKIIEKLLTIEDFRKAYELTPELADILKKVGVSIEGFGTNGLKYEEWGSFGSTVKTMNGFTEAYNKFREKVFKIAMEVKGKK